MTKRKKQLLVVLVVSGIGVIGGFAAIEYLSRPEPGVNEECFAALRCGMSLEEIEAILGRPADEELNPVGRNTRAWQDGGFIIILEFDANERLTDGRRVYMTIRLMSLEREGLVPPPSFLDRIKALLHL